LGGKRGLSEGKVRGSWVRRLALWCVPGLCVALACAGVSFWILRDHAYFHVTAVRVYGAEHVSPQELMDLAQVRAGISLWRIDAGRIRARLRQHPWIRDVLVQRLFPNALELTVYERKPSAILAAHPGYILDGEGYVLGPFDPRERSGLPRLMVPGDQAWTPGQQVTDPAVKAALRVLAQSQEQAFFRNANIDRIEIINPERFVLHTRRGKLVIGANLAAVEDKLALLPAVEEVLRPGSRRIEAIDLSFATQIVVKTASRTPQGIGRLQKRGSGSGQAH
jgi:cell division protein FtsQ